MLTVKLLLIYSTFFVGNAFRPKRQQEYEQQQGFSYDTPQTPESQYAQPPADQLGPHVEVTTQVLDVVPQVPQEVAVETKKKTPQPDSDEDDDDESSFPIFMGMGKGKGRQQPSFSFFPIMFGGGSGGQGFERSGGAPGGSIAIANSFSTGRKGMANSNAFSNGDPNAFRNLGRYQQQ